MLTHECKGNASYKHLSIKQENIDLYYKKKPRIFATVPEYDDEEDFAYEIVEECYDLPEFAKTYFDYKQFARDLFMCDYWFDDGFVFRAA